MLEDIDHSNYFYTGELPKAIGDLANLSVLDVAGNALSGMHSTHTERFGLSD